jgi:hypothetical protein
MTQVRKKGRRALNAPIEWLLEGEPWIEYRARRDLLGQSENDPQVESSRQRMLANVQVQDLIAELSGWPGTVISSHKSASQPFHKLTFVADLGLVATDPGVDTIVARILEHQSVEGPFQLPVNIPTHYGGTGEDRWAWALCDAPLVVYALVEFGLKHEPAVRTALEHLAGTCQRLALHCLKGAGHVPRAGSQGRPLSICELGHAQGTVGSR